MQVFYSHTSQFAVHSFFLHIYPTNSKPGKHFTQEISLKFDVEHFKQWSNELQVRPGWEIQEKLGLTTNPFSHTWQQYLEKAFTQF